MKYHVIVFGCQMNISDSERISTILDELKYKNTSNINEADLIVVTMCSVRQSAVDRVHGLALKFSRLKAQTILTGCFLKKDEKVFANEFDYIVNIKDIKKLPALLAQQSNFFSGRTPLRVRRPSKNLLLRSYLAITPKYSNKFSANVPIMTGCNNFCAYCVVPYTRDREVSRPAKEIISEIKNLIKKGYKEVWLLGQNVNSYKDKNTNFPKLLKAINNIPGNFWIRFTSSHPKDFDNEVIETMALGKNITPYLNLPIQSGDDKILKLMNRHYTVKDYKNKIKKLREKIPDISLSTDIIVGFPSETKKQFENTAKLFREIKFDMAYINKYSPRTGTSASKFKNDVSTSEKKRREKALTEF
jgi:tRNA-2-methylthio-N6-dimethylallyladenosine synthase